MYWGSVYGRASPGARAGNAFFPITILWTTPPGFWIVNGGPEVNTVHGTGTCVLLDATRLPFIASRPSFIAIWITTGAEDGYQTPEVCANLVARFGHAFEDLDTPAALAQLGA